VIEYRAQFGAAVRAATIRGPTRYAWLGQGSRGLAASLEAEMDEALRDAYLVSSLAAELYSSFYCQGRPVPARWGEPQPFVPDHSLAAALSSANTGSGSWEGGWTVERIEEPDVVVSTPRLRVRTPAGMCRAPGGMRPAAAVAVRMPKEHMRLWPGFYTAMSDAPMDGPFNRGVLRVYWHLTPAGAPALMRTLTARLNALRMPFRLKVADHPARLNRCDGAVLYLAGERFDAARPTLLEAAAELAGHLRPSIPAFTLPLVRGVGLAEHDGGAESFGSHRCRLLAEAIVRAHKSGVDALDERITVVADHFADHGVTIDAPYLEPSLSDCHVL
jgi:HopA1 effector protein family